jgi:hypothetical protein
VAKKPRCAARQNRSAIGRDGSNHDLASRNLECAPDGGQFQSSTLEELKKAGLPQPQGVYAQLSNELILSQMADSLREQMKEPMTWKDFRKGRVALRQGGETGRRAAVE